MWKKLALFILLCAVVMYLNACSDSGEDASSAKGEMVEVSLIDATYVLTGQDDDVSEGAEKGMLMVDLKVKNLDDSSIRVSTLENIKLYDGDEQSDPIQQSNRYVNIDSIDSTQIGSGKVETMSVLFEVEKDKKYEIAIITNSFEGENEEVILELNTEEYAESYDALQNPAKALEAYIDMVYLDRDNINYKAYVTADKEALQKDAKKGFAETLDSEFREGIPGQDLDDMYDGFRSTLAKVSEINAEVTAIGNDKAEVTLEYTALPLNDLTEVMSKYREEFRGKNDVNFKKENEYLISKFNSILNDLKVKAGKDIDVRMVKKDGKWTLDSSYEYNGKIEKVFGKGIVF